MTLTLFIILLVVAGIIGSIGEAIAGFSLGGFFVSCAVGFIGALIGNYLAAYFKLPDLYRISIAGSSFPIIWSIIGSTLFVMVVGLLTRRKA